MVLELRFFLVVLLYVFLQATDVDSVEFLPSFLCVSLPLMPRWYFVFMFPQGLLLFVVDELARGITVGLAIEMMDVRLRSFLRMRHVCCALSSPKITLSLLSVAAELSFLLCFFLLKTVELLTIDLVDLR